MFSGEVFKEEMELIRGVTLYIFPINRKEKKWARKGYWSQIHHTNPDLKNYKWGQISRKWDVLTLINEFILKEECIILCGNCLSMINTKNFENNISKIIGEEYQNEVS